MYVTLTLSVTDLCGDDVAEIRNAFILGESEGVIYFADSPEYCEDECCGDRVFAVRRVDVIEITEVYVAGVTAEEDIIWEGLRASLSV